MAINFQQAEFIRSATAPKDFPRDGLPQVAFAGRSNVGKSSVINRLLGRKNFARVGAAPGKTALTGAERIWFVMDCGSEIGNAAGYNRQLAAQKHLRYMGTAQIIMPENYIAMFHAPQAEQARRIVEQAAPALQKVLAQLRAGQEFSPLRDTLYDRFMSGPVNPAFYRFFVKADAFRATDACIGCGKCMELCPLNNIRLENGKPVWGKNCTHCMACICYCPKEAIEYGKKSKGKPRYHFEALEKQPDSAAAHRQ